MIHIVKKADENFAYCGGRYSAPFIDWLGENRLRLFGSVLFKDISTDDELCVRCIENLGASRVVSQVDTERLIEG